MRDELNDSLHVLTSKVTFRIATVHPGKTLARVSAFNMEDANDTARA